METTRKIRVNLVADGRESHELVSTDFALAIVASLSADPERETELRAALERFWPQSGPGDPSSWSRGLDLEPAAETVLVDLTARMVVWRSSHPIPPAQGTYSVTHSQGTDSCEVWYRLAADWIFTDDINQWNELADGRRSARRKLRQVNRRKILYGKAVDFIAKRCIEECAETPRDADRSTVVRLISEIHAEWLTSARADLGGMSPRDVLLADRDRIDSDLQSRRDQWSQTGECPVGLHRDSAAFRYGGFGTHEIVIYYDLLRYLLHDCWNHVGKVFKNQRRPDERREAQRLAKTSKEWLNTASDEGLEGQIPSDVIDSERRRVPLTVSGEQAMIDCDCPLCQMMAESGPVFLHLDGCHMDDDFAFSLHEAEGDWRSEQDEREQEAQEWEQERAVTIPLPQPEPKSPWERSYFSREMENSESPQFLLMAIAACVAELGLDLKQRSETASLAIELNRHFGNLREVARNGTGALLAPVVERFKDAISDAAEARPELGDKCRDLCTRLENFVPRLGVNR